MGPRPPAPSGSPLRDPSVAREPGPAPRRRSVPDLVVLVNERDEDIGTEEKLRAHRGGGLLHRAVSVIVLDSRGRVMIQRRARDKYHFAGLWANTCCTHPGPGAEARRAAEARLVEEMGFEAELREVGTFLYRATDPATGLTEHELDHLFVGRHDGEPRPDPAEVDDWRWIDLDGLRADARTNPASYTPWLDPLLEAFSRGFRPPIRAILPRG